MLEDFLFETTNIKAFFKKISFNKNKFYFFAFVEFVLFYLLLEVEDIN